MALNRTKLADIQYIPSSVGSIYSNPASTKTYVRSIVIFNGNTTAETVKLYNVPDSGGSLGTAGAGNQFFEQAIAAKETVEFSVEYPMVLTDTNDSIQASTTTGSKVTVQINGDKDA
jgi:hypothetical protein